MSSMFTACCCRPARRGCLLVASQSGFDVSQAVLCGSETSDTIHVRVPTAGLRINVSGELLASVDGPPAAHQAARRAQLRSATALQDRTWRKVHPTVSCRWRTRRAHSAAVGSVRLRFSPAHSSRDRAPRGPLRPQFVSSRRARTEPNLRRTEPTAAESARPIRHLQLTVGWSLRHGPS